MTTISAAAVALQTTTDDIQARLDEIGRQWAARGVEAAPETEGEIHPDAYAELQD